MKKVFTFILTICTLPLLAQVTVDQSSFPRPAGYIDNVTQASISGVALPTEGADQAWDYSSLSATSTFSTQWHDASGDIDFPTALNYENTELFFQTFVMRARIYEAVDADGWYNQGRSIFDTTFSITAISGGANDVLNFPTQVQPNHGRNNFLEFPASLGSTWTESFYQETQFNLTVVAFGLSNTPGLQRSRIEITRTVVGDGTLVIPDENGNPSGTLDAILVKLDAYTAVDSFFLGGQPAPAQLLTAFGLTQGAETDYNPAYLFYVPGFTSPVLNINLDASEAISSAYYKPSAAALATSINDAQALTALKTYPNPIAAGASLSVGLGEGADGISTIELMDVTGRTVANQTIQPNTNTAQLAIPSTVVAGIYSVILRDAKNTLLQTTRIVVQ